MRGLGLRDARLDAAVIGHSGTSAGVWRMNPAYFEIRFRISDSSLAWPPEFAIISAYATTGETWSPRQNLDADKALNAALNERSVWHARVEGYSPGTGHAEPSWAAEVGSEDGRRLGRMFHQHAIFCVSGDLLSVTLCRGGQPAVDIGSFRSRLDPVV